MHGFLGIQFEPNILAVIGLILAISFLGSKLFQRIGIPQVVGFIVIGVVLGPSFLNVVPLELYRAADLHQRDRPGPHRL